jgi:hypothetical protein
MKESLSPGEGRKVAVIACFDEPGNYDMSRWKLSVELETITAKSLANTEAKFVYMPNQAYFVQIQSQ